MPQAKPTIVIPPGSTATVKLINPVNFGPAILERFMGPPVPGLDTFDTSPSLTFLIEHPSGRRLVWDLGIRKDYKNYAPSIAEYIPTTNYNIQVTKDVAEILEEEGIKREDIEAVIWSHWHWDHIGSPAIFPPSTDLIVGQGFKQAMLPGAPTNPSSPILESDYTGRNLREISFEGPGTLKIGKFPAFDYFNDGSFYLLDSPGHAIGHMCGLVRTTTTSDTFVLLGGDICHYAGLFRPSQYQPVPESISPNPCDHDSSTPLCPGSAFVELQAARGRETTDTLYDIKYGHDIPLATKTTGWLQELDSDERIFVIIAHDSTVRDYVDHFPLALNDWKQRGWGGCLKWMFLRDLKKYWNTKGVH